MIWLIVVKLTNFQPVVHDPKNLSSNPQTKISARITSAWPVIYVQLEVHVPRSAKNASFLLQKRDQLKCNILYPQVVIQSSALNFPWSAQDVLVLDLILFRRTSHPQMF